MTNIKSNSLISKSSLAIWLMMCGSMILAQELHEHPIVYVPKCYVCYQVPNINLKIDGQLDEPEWEQVIWTDLFVDIEGSLQLPPPLATKVKMMWDKEYFYIAAMLEEPFIWGKLTQRDATIFYDDDFEVFLDPDGDTHNYYEIEINALNTVWDLMLLMPYRENKTPKALNAWDVKGLKSAVHVQGTLNDHTDQDQYWSVEMAIPWPEITEMAIHKGRPVPGEQWRINFSRVDWPKEVINGAYTKKKDAHGKNLPANNWVWSPQGYIDMHRPETWGFVTFDLIQNKNSNSNCVVDQEDQIKWALRNLYLQQRRKKAKLGHYCTDIKELVLPNLDIENYAFRPQLECGGKGYLISAPSMENGFVWYIRADGKVWKERNSTNKRSIK